MSHPKHKTLDLTSSEKRAAMTDLLKLLHLLGIESADPKAVYGGSAQHFDHVINLFNSGLLSQAEAIRLLGFPACKKV